MSMVPMACGKQEANFQLGHSVDVNRRTGDQLQITSGPDLRMVSLRHSSFADGEPGPGCGFIATCTWLWPVSSGSRPSPLIQPLSTTILHTSFQLRKSALTTAMLTSVYANLLAHFYLIGNTPAVCLTQGLPVEKEANILLLGCGDVRNFLFTAHSDCNRDSNLT
jgi:hypothetical protein